MSSTLTYVLGDGELVVSESLPDQCDTLLIDLADFGEREAGNAYRRLDPALRLASRVVFRGRSARLLDFIATDEILLDLLQDKEVAVIAPHQLDGGFEVALRTPDGFHGFSDDRFLRQARGMEVLAWLRQTGAILDQQGTHFVLPSGIHAASFIRAADLSTDARSVERLADWLSPYLTPESSIISDTSGLLALLYALQLRGMEAFHWKIPTATLDGYPFSATAVIRVLRDLARITGRSGQPVLILSINSSGRIARIFRDLAPSDARIVALVHARTEGPDDLDDWFLEYPVERWQVSKEGVCPRCSSQRRVFIDRKTLFPIPDREYTLEKPSIPQYTRNRDFWLVASATRAIRLHADAPYGSALSLSVRHHPVFIDVRQLLKDDEFRRQCAEVLLEISKPDLILIPRHPATEALENLAHEVYGDETRTEIVNSSERFGHSLREAVLGARRILVLDDVVVTGSTVVGIKNELYRITQASGSLPQLDCVVVVCRPSSTRLLKNTKNPFFAEDGRHFKSVVTLFLPAGKKGCPWCEERDLLRQFHNAGVLKLSEGAQAYLEERIRVLASEPRDLPIMANAERLSPDQLVDNLPEDLRTLGSFFGEIDEATAFAAACSVIQEFVDSLHTEDLFVAKVADVPFFVRAFFDIGLIAGILRTLRIENVRLAGYDEEVSQALDSHPAQLAYPGVVAELALAAAVGKVPAQPVLDLMHNVPEGPALELLEEIIGRQIRPTS